MVIHVVLLNANLNIECHKSYYKPSVNNQSTSLFLYQVRNSDAISHDTKRSLRRDHRWELADLLEAADKEKLFREHVEALAEKKRLQFRKLLEETPQVCSPC